MWVSTCLSISDLLPCPFLHQIYPSSPRHDPSLITSSLSASSSLSGSSLPYRGHSLHIPYTVLSYGLMPGLLDFFLQSPCARSVPFHPIILDGFTVPSQVFFTVYHYNLVRSVSGLPQSGSSNFGELQTAFERVLKTGLADLSVDEESLDVERPGSPAEHLAQLQPDDPRAIEFREYMRAWYLFIRVRCLLPH